MDRHAIVTYTVRSLSRGNVIPKRKLLCVLLGHRYPAWEHSNLTTAHRFCKRCGIEQCRGPAWTVLP